MKLLHVVYNDIIVISPEIGQLTNLEDLYLTANTNLNSLPTTIKRLVKLKHLKYDCTGFSDIVFQHDFKTPVKEGLENINQYFGSSARNAAYYILAVFEKQKSLKNGVFKDVPRDIVFYIVKLVLRSKDYQPHLWKHLNKI